MASEHGRLFFLMLVSLLPTGVPARAEPPPAASAGFDALVEVYRGYGLPLAPPDAPLVRFVNGHRVAEKDKEEPIYRLAFLLKAGAAGQPAVLLVGTEQKQMEEKAYAVTILRPEDVKPGEVEPGLLASTFEVNAGLATAVQCKARGWDGLAKGLLADSLKGDVGHRFSLFYQPAGLPPKTAVAYLAWAHWGNELTRPGTDLAAIAKRIRALLATEPALDTKPNQALLRSLEAALVPRRAKPGSVEAMIDDLVELDDTHDRPSGKPDARYLKLSLLGFEAVPAMIDHLGDDRLTRSVKQGFNNFPTWNKRVGDVVSDLLQELAGDDLGQDWLDRQKGYEVEQAAARAWWEKVKPAGEEAYAVAHVLPEGPKGEWPNSALLRIIAARYPAHLPGVYRTILDQRQSLQSWPVAEAVAGSGLPREQKVALFLHAAGNTNLEHRRAAYWQLKALDPEAFVALLVKTLDGLPATPEGSYWKCREASFANLVMETDDPRAWAALGRAARRADVGLRMELMNPMDYTYVGDRQRRQRVEFLAGFLTDAAVRDASSDPKRFDGPYAGFTFPRLAVRDLAAMKIASVLDLSVEPWPNKEWTADQWTALRARAGGAAERQSEGASSSRPSQ